MSNEKICVNIYGASHADSVGMTLSGIPAGLKIDVDELQRFCDRRKSNDAVYSTSRGEEDKLIVLGGIKNGYTTDEQIQIEIKNHTANSDDYNNIKDTPRPSHADYAAKMKYGEDYDMTGGGKFSGRMTAAICMAGGIAKQILESEGIIVGAYIAEIAGVRSASYLNTEITADVLKSAAEKELPIIDGSVEKKIINKIFRAKTIGDSVGGVVEGVVLNLPVGIGDNLYDGMESEIAKYLFGIPAVKGIEFGAGFKLANMRGSDANDEFYWDNDVVKTRTNNSGGINGGISNGMPITVRVAFRPTPSIAKAQNTVNLKTKENTVLLINGRHDACVVPRATVVVEASLALAILSLKGI